jgi:diguanylate cyclase (GGDEF)-like protein/PAS domain S-box-containing protein
MDPMHPTSTGPTAASRRAGTLFHEHRNELLRTTDLLFAGLLAFQWLAAIVTALVVSPRTWAGASSQLHPHVWAATMLGGLLVSLPIGLALTRPARAATRHSIAVAQMLMGALLIHLSGGRIETHFHVFGSLAFLAFYRDWTVLVSGSAVVALDHLLRGLFWPQSVYGVSMIEPWRWVEHAGWVIFEDLFLVRSCRKGIREMRDIAERQAALEVLHEQIERQVEARTAELHESESLKSSIIETALDAIVTMDHDGRIVEFNPAAEQIFGYSKDRAAGQRLEELIIPPAQRQAHLDALARFVSTGHGRSVGRRIDVFALRADGTEFPAELAINPVHRDGSPPLFVGFARDITERKRAEERLAYQATHDALTGLPNRAQFQSELERYLGEPRQADVPLALLLVDLDRFKEVNDAFGHHYGDLLLQGLGPHLRGALCGSGTVARIGGDEFGIILPGADAARAIRATEAILAAVRQPVVVKGQALEVGASVGIALCPDHTRDPIALLQCADVAMYAAKRARAGYMVYSAGQPECTPRRVALIGELRRGIDQDQLLLHYQPKINLRTQAVDGVEALVRWIHPREGLLGPGEFVEMAEDTGLIKPLTFWVLHTALLQCRAWHQTGASLNVAINLAADMLREPELVEIVTAHLESTDALPEWLTLEVTESAVMADPEQARETLARLRRIGVRISIDDFGTGYSSLAYLRDLPVNEVKIDRSFVTEMDSREQDACIVRSVIELGHNLGLQVVAEGVEAQTTVERLAGMGCDYVQGFHFSRPLPPVEFAAWLIAFRDAADHDRAILPPSMKSDSRRLPGIYPTVR